jgi:hypothetical protein|nr:MAG TPA: hypothetical protein [Caudoviricetes sp.]
MESIVKKYLSKLSNYKDTLGSIFVSSDKTIKIVAFVYILLALLPFITAYIFLIFEFFYHDMYDVDRLIKLGSTIISDSATGFVLFILGLVTNGEKMVNNKIASNSSIMNKYLKDNNLQVKPYTEEQNTGKK